ncbi:MAG: SUMF1/EgtB/PvdO family nonheme iron enzyme [Blastocatellia bacterium]
MLESRRCAVCGETYFPPTRVCLKDGAELQVVQTLIGTMLDDRYRIDDILGAGGMGTVYRATHVHLESEFAVKVLHPEMVSYDGAIERFRREAKAARRIQHPNAIEVTDFGVTADNLVYLVMEIVEGRLLREMINEGRFEYHRTVELLCQVCAAIQAAHDNKVIHRDLKPDNIIIQRIGAQEMVKVLDFGIAKLLEANHPAGEQRALTQQGMLIGTPQYMSPEQCQGRDLEPPSDIYSLGIIAYEMLCGQTPFVSQTQMGYIAKHLREEPRPLRSLAPRVPASIERVIMRTLAKEPEDRPATASDFARELREAVREADERGNPASARDTLIESRPDGKATLAITTPKTVSAPTDPAQSRETQVGELKPSLATAPVEDRPTAEIKSRLPLAGLAAAVLLALCAGIYFAFFRGSDAGPQQNAQVTAPANQPGEMALIRGGKFVMGSADGDSDERPVHEVQLNDFLLDRNEVTNEQYKKCVDAKQCRAPSNWAGGVYPPDESLLPVTHVTWADAATYARFAGKRLPTEAEWEYAARGGDANNSYPWGPRWEDSAANVSRENASEPAPVSSFKRDQALGVYDLAGNVSEWVEDDYKTYVRREPIPDCRKCKVYRGGNFIDDVRDSRATKRWAVFPDVPQPYDKVVLPRVGFRCAKDAK